MSEHLAIKVRNVSKKYSLRHPITNSDGVVTQEHWALKDVSFDVKKGESVGIIGPNGSGKSTLLRILSGITTPTSGEIEIYGKVASILDIGAGFHPELSGRENIFLNGQLLGFSRNEIEGKYKEIVAFSEIENFIEEPVKHYSNGMYLRLAFSILAHLDFDIYLFDEVLSVGDASFQLKVIHFLEHKRDQEQATLIFVSHQVTKIQSQCSTVYLINQGIISIENPYQAIDNYVNISFKLNSSELIYSEKIFEKNEAADTEFFELKHVGVVELKSINELCFFTKIKVKKSARFDISFGIESLLGNELLYISTLLKKEPILDLNSQEENINIQSSIPSNILKPGKYVLSLTLIVNGHTIISRIKCCYFETLITEQSYNKLIEQGPNVPLLLGNWLIKYAN